MTPNNNRNKNHKFQAQSGQASNRISAAKNVPKDNYQVHSPIFSLQHLSTESKFSFDSCNDAHKVKFVDTLYKLSRMNWAGIQQAHKHGLGTEKIPRESIKAPIPSHIKDDVNFLAFRFDGTASMVGYRDKDIFHVIWIDRLYKLYDH